MSTNEFTKLYNLLTMKPRYYFFLILAAITLMAFASPALSQTVPENIYQVPQDPTVQQDTKPKETGEENIGSKLFVGTAAIILLVAGMFFVIKRFSKSDKDQDFGFAETSPEQALGNLRQSFENGFVTQEEYEEKRDQLAQEIKKNI